jgi:flagellar hook-associated protein 3 FlgL
MRISTTQMSLDAVNDLNSSMTQVQNYSEELSTGLAVNEPSDNPQAAGEIVNLDSDISLDTGYTDSAQTGAAQLTQASSALGQVLTLLNSVQSSAETGLNSATENQGDLDNLATSVNTALSQILSLANTQSNGQSLFAGYQVNGPAFTATTTAGQITGVTYNGDDGVNSAQVGTDTSVATNIPGGQVFDAAGSSVFQSVIAIAQALQSGDQSGLNAGLAQLTSSIQTVTASQAQTGALQQTLQNQESSLSTLQTNLNTNLGQVQNANMTTVATAYQQALNTYEAGMQAAGLVAQLPSIVNYM